MITILFNTTAFAEIATPLFAPNTQSGINWKTGPSDMHGLELHRTGKASMGEIKIYRDKSDKLGYGEIKFNSVGYGFSKNDLIFVAYKASGKDNRAAFKKIGH